MRIWRRNLLLAPLAAATLVVLQCGGSSGKSDAGAQTSDAASEKADAASCPASAPAIGDSCDTQSACDYGAAHCTCLDPGPTGAWQCVSAPADAGGNPAGCPTDTPQPGDPCGDAGAIDGCHYGAFNCGCDPTDGWTCIL